MATTEKNPMRVITGRVKLSYPTLFTPRGMSNDPNSKPAYSTTLMVPKTTSDGKATIERIRAAEKLAIEKGKTEKWKGKVPRDLKSVIHDGDDEKYEDSNPEYAGHWVLAVRSPRRPGLVDRNLERITDESEIYPGVIAKVSVSAFPFDVSGSKGIGFGLNNVQKIGDAEPLAGPSRPEDDFEVEDSEDDGDDLV